MKVTIISADGAVYKDGFFYSGLKLIDVPKNVHALQWSDVAGWIEFSVDGEGNKAPNETITELPIWANSALAAWEAEKTAEETAIAEAAARITAQE